MLLLILLLAAYVDGVFLPLYAYHKPQCFLTKQVLAGGMIAGSFEISGTGEGMEFHMFVLCSVFLEVNVSLNHPTTDAPVWTSRQLTDHFKYTAVAPGQYNLCFKQTSNRGRQTASFQIHVSGDADFYGEVSTNIASKNQADKVNSLAQQIEQQMRDLLDHQDYSITREAVHRDTAESTNTRVLWWSLAQVAVMVTLSLLQMYYIKSFFEIKLIV